MNGWEYLEHAVQILLRHGVIHEVTAKMMQEAREELHRHAMASYLQKGASANCLLETLVPFLAELPACLVWFDAEMDATTYADLVRTFADATGGEWSPSLVDEDIAANKEMGDYRIRVDFEVNGEPIHGEWTTLSLKWVEDGFIDLIIDVAEKYLSGEFVDIPMHDQTMLFAYLPRPVVRDLQALLDLLEQEYPDFAMFMRTL